MAQAPVQSGISDDTTPSTPEVNSCDVRLVVMLPTYNNATKIEPVLDGVAALGRPMLIVNDGATDDTQQVIASWREQHPRVELDIVTHDINKGKGEALRTGFKRATQMGYTHALTIDTDGQHDPEDAPGLIAAAEQNPTALVTGWRDSESELYPARSRVGRRLANLAIYMSAGRRVEDSQCGYRVYPLGLVNAVSCWSGRYGYESEILTRSGWSGCDLEQVPIKVIYPPKGERISHYKPVKDSVYGYFLQFLLTMRAVWPWPYVKWPGKRADAGPKVAWWRKLGSWVDPRELWRQIKHDKVSQMSVAAGLGIGVLVANLPVYPFQMLLAVYFSKRLHLHPVATVFGTQLSMPPISIGLIAGAIYLGRIILTGSPPAWSDFEHLRDMGFQEFHHLFRGYFFSWLVGGVILGLIMGWATFLLSLFVFRFVPVNHTAAED